MLSLKVVFYDIYYRDVNTLIVKAKGHRSNAFGEFEIVDLVWLGQIHIILLDGVLQLRTVM